MYNTYDGEPKWGFNDITYSFTNALDGGLQGVGGPLNVNHIRAAVAEAFAMWAAVTPLQFRENIDPNPSLVTDETYDGEGLPIIRIGQHNIDGQATGTLAHAWEPGEGGRNGDMHFDINETWIFGATSGTTIDILEVAAHEIGHTIGLDHETVNPSLMTPTHARLYSGPGTGSLLADDIAGIQHLYGAGLGYVIDVSGNMWVAGTSGANTLSLSYNPVNSTINVVSNGFGSFSRSISGIREIRFIGSGGNDIFNIGQTPFPVEVDGGTGSDQLNLFGSDSSNSYFINGNNVTGHSVSTHSNIESMAVFGSNLAGDSFTLNASPTIPVTLNGQGGSDHFTVNAAPNVAVALNGQADGDTITLNVLSTNLTVNGGAGNDTIEVNEPTAAVTDPTVTLNAGDGDDLFRVTRLARGLVLNGGTGNDTFDVARGATMAGAVLGSIVVNGFDGNDVVNLAPSTLQVNATTAAISIFGGNDNDTLNLGGGSVSSVGGSVTFDGGTHTGPGNTININDTARGGDVSWVISTTAVGRGLGGPDVTYNSSTSRIILSCGSGNDDIVVASGVNPILEVYGNNGNDEFVVGGGMMDSGAGPIIGGFNGGNGTDQITYDDHLRTSRVIWDVHPTSVNYGGIFVLGTNSFEAVGILAGNGDDEIVFFGDIGSKPITVDAGGGNDTIDTNGCRALNLNIAGGAGSDILEVDDVGIPTGTIFQHILSANQVLRYDFIAEYNVFYDAIEQLDLILPAQQNNVYVAGTAAGVWTQVIGTSFSDTLTLSPRDAAGNATVQGPLNFFCGDGADVFELDAAASSTPAQYVLGLDFFGFNPMLSGVGAGAVMVQNSETIRLRAGGGDDTFRVNAFPGIAIAVPALELYGGGGDDTVHFGNGNLPANITAMSAFGFDGQGGVDTLELDNAGAAGQWAYTNTAAYIEAQRLGTATPYVRRLNYANLEQLNVNAGPGTDALTLSGLAAGQGLRFNAGDGDDAMNLIDGPSAVLGPVHYSGGGGSNRINHLTNSRTDPITVHLTQDSIGTFAGDNYFAAGGSLRFDDVSDITLTMGSGADTVYAQPNATAAVTLRGGAPTSAGGGGDTLNLALAEAQIYVLTEDGNGGGSVTSDNRRPLVFSDFELTGIDDDAPRALTGRFDIDAPRQQVIVSFSEDVGAALRPEAFILRNLTSGQTIDAAVMSLEFNAAQRRATLRFPGLPNGILPDGNYELLLPAGAAFDFYGNATQAELRREFFFLNGDANGDRRVDEKDARILGRHFGHNDRTFSQGDFNYDGTVDEADEEILLGNFGTYLPPPG